MKIGVRSVVKCAKLGSSSLLVTSSLSKMKQKGDYFILLLFGAKHLFLNSWNLKERLMVNKRVRVKMHRFCCRG